MTHVQWFPGHMAKAIRLIEEQLKVVDFVVECRDSRAPLASRNPVLAQSIGQKKSLVILTKKDLSNPAMNQYWVDRLVQEGHEVLSVDVRTDDLKKLILAKTAIIMAPKHERDQRRGIQSRASRALIVGVPNVGKSSIINRIASRKAVTVENRPGVTQALKLVKVSPELELVDTPGVLWPKFETVDMGIICALIGSVKETGFPLNTVTDYARDYFMTTRRGDLEQRYGMVDDADLFAAIAKKRGYFGDESQAMARKTFLHDIQNGKLGPITWER